MEAILDQRSLSEEEAVERWPPPLEVLLAAIMTLECELGPPA